MRFDSVAEFEHEFEGFICKGAVRVEVVEGLPAPLEPFDFQLASPAGGLVPLRGMIVSQHGGVALVQILEFTSAVVATIRASGAKTRTLPRPTPSGLETVPATAPPTAATPLLGGTPPLLAMRLSAVRNAAGTTRPPATQDPRSTLLPSVGPEELLAASLDAPLPKPSQTGVFPIVGAPASGPLEGALVNPSGLDGLLQLPLGPIAAVRDLAAVSTVGLLRFLGARRVSGFLKLTGDAGGERKLGLERGSFLLSPQEREALRPVFQWPTGRYTFEPGVPEHAPHRLTVSAWRLVLDAAKLVIRDARPDEMSRRIDPAQAVRLTAAFTERARTLDLTAPEERIVRRDFDGRLSLREIYKLGAMAELNVQRLVFLLTVLGLGELVVPEGGAPSSASDEVRLHYDRLVAGDLFAALGMHWSDPPERVPQALEATRRRYGTGSPAAATSPEYAVKLVELAERAYRKLTDRAGRRAYRDELGVDVRLAADLLVAQVPLCKARGEYRKAYELMSAACDLFDAPAWERMRTELATAKPPT